GGEEQERAREREPQRLLAGERHHRREAKEPQGAPRAARSQERAARISVTTQRSSSMPSVKTTGSERVSPPRVAYRQTARAKAVSPVRSTSASTISKDRVGCASKKLSKEKKIWSA